MYGPPGTVTHMKTTVELPDELVKQVKALAHEQGVTLRELMVEGLRGELERRSAAQDRIDFVFRTTGGDGLAAGVQPGTLTARAYDLPL